jgi:uncharacterized protein (DUF697 family)/uncharacterized tellurite resistance protein B-like protein
MLLITDTEMVAGLRILVAVAQADGTIHDDERAALSGALEDVKLPEGTTVDTLLAEDVDVEKELGAITRVGPQDAIYWSAYGMAHADGRCSPEEQQLLDRIRRAWQIPDVRSTMVARLFKEAKDTVLPSHIQPIDDPAKRSREIREDVLKYSFLGALLGAFPIPGVAIATDLAIVAVQVKMVRDIGQYHGHHVDRESAKSLLYGLGLGTGARIAVNNLAKLIPGWGSAFGAVTSFAATFALGKVIDKYFVDGKRADPALLKKEFSAAQKEGKAAYAEHKESIDALERQRAGELAQLGENLKEGKITLEEYELEVEALK